MKRSLTLRTERLAELSAGELAAVNGGTNSVKVCVVITGPNVCPTVGCTGYYPSIFDPCG